MNQARKTHPVSRWLVLIAVLIGVLSGVLLICNIEKFAMALRYWIFSEPQATVFRFGGVLFGLCMLLSVPLLGLACYLWRMGDRVVQTQVFPPADYEVLRDLSVITGPKALLRGRTVKLLAISIGLTAFVISFAFWYLAKQLFLADA